MAVDGNWNIVMSTPMGERKATLTLNERRRHADGHAGRRRQFRRDLRRHRRRRRRRLENLDHQPDAADAGILRQGFRRQHVRRNGHRPDGQLPVHGDKGLIQQFVVPAQGGDDDLGKTHTCARSFPLAVLISLTTTASAQHAAEPEPVWRASALALVPAGYVAGEAWRTDETAMTGLLAVYPAQADDPKSPGSVFAPRQVLVVKLASQGWRDHARCRPR